MLARLILGVVIQYVGLNLCFYSEKVWTVAPWFVMAVLSYVLVIHDAYRRGTKASSIVPRT